MSAQPQVTIRRARARDQAAIDALVRRERLNPHGIEWPRFRVAVEVDAVVGAVQMRSHRDGSLELGSLVVERSRRGRGIAARLVEQLLAGEVRPIHVITSRTNAHHYRRWGFRPIGWRHAPPCVRRNWLLGQLAGVLSLLGGRRPRRLAILERPDPVGCRQGSSTGAGVGSGSFSTSSLSTRLRSMSTTSKR